MKPEDAPITDDEFLLRRVRKEHFPTDKDAFVFPNAFKPRLKGRDIDTDGISLFREACLADSIEVLATIQPEKRHENGIIRVSVAFVKSLGLTILSKPDPRIKGHVVVPELNSTDYESDESRFTSFKAELAFEASKAENIVKIPGSPTNE